MTDPVAGKVLEIIAAQARRPVAEVALEASPEDLGLDSLNLVEMVFAIEEAFDISVPFSAQDDARKAEFDTSSVQAMIEAVRRLVGPDAA